MSFTPLKLDAVIFATIATPATPVTTFGAISEAGIDENAGFFADGPAGHPAPTVVALAKAAPRLTFSTPQIDVAMNALTSWGIQCSARAYQKNSTGAAPAARNGTTNEYKSIAAGIAGYTRVSLPQARQGQAGRCDITVLAAYNGVAAPIVNNASQALVADALGGSFFAAGPVYLNTAAVAGVQSIEITNQMRFSGEGDADSIFDTYVEGTTSGVMVTITTLSTVNWKTVLAAGLAVTDLTFFARKWQEGGLVSFYANDATEHILFNSTNCVAAPVSSRAMGQGLFLETFNLLCGSESVTAPPLSATIGQAIVAPE